MARKQQENQTYEIDTGIAEVVEEPDGSVTLLVNGVPSSNNVPGDPERLEFEYMRWIVAAIEELPPSQAKPRLTHLGGAGCSLARYFAHLWPASRNTVVEIDMELAQLVRQIFDIPKSPAVKIRVGDAREETDNFYPASRDILIRDVFAGATTPRSLTTVEFSQPRGHRLPTKASTWPIVVRMRISPMPKMSWLECWKCSPMWQPLPIHPC